MILGDVLGYGLTLYNVLLVVHIGAAIGTFGPAMAYALLNRRAIASSGQTRSELARIPSVLNRQSLPALIVAMVAGMGLIVASDGLFEFSESWVSASFAIVLAVGALMWFMIGPAQDRLVAALDANDEKSIETSRKNVAMATGMFHLGMVLLLILMVWKPGS